MKIIAATDFSPAAFDAAHAGAQLARRLGDSLLVVHALEPPLIQYPELGPAADLMVDAVRRDREAQLAELARTLEPVGAPVEHRLVVGGAAEVITKLAASEKARLVVAGTHGRGASKRVFLGTVAERVVLGAPCPVLVLKEGAAPFEDWMDGRRPLRVLVGVDNAPSSNAALAWAKDLSKAGACQVTLVHEYWPRMPGRPEANPEIAAMIEDEIARALANVRGGRPSKVRVRPVSGTIVESLASEAEAAGADLLVVGTHQPHGWQSVNPGSTAIGVTRASEVPVVCVPGLAYPIYFGTSLAPR